eukprot:9385550-Alexandrium_andersonii.AAC.1
MPEGAQKRPKVLESALGTFGQCLKQRYALVAMHLKPLEVWEGSDVNRLRAAERAYGPVGRACTATSGGFCGERSNVD